MGKATLVIMAAGIGSRFGGGIKQLEQIGPSGEIIMDYSVYDALEAGFDKVVFVIRKDLDEDFRKVIGRRIEKIVKVDYVYQELLDIPEQFRYKAKERKKPWGTGQAILCCKDVVKEPFLVINSDDYYGKEAYQKAYEYLTDSSKDSYSACMIGFILKNTLSDNGGVTRGVCKVDKHHMLTEIVETRNIVKRGNGAVVIGEDGGEHAVDVDSEVSMNMWGLSPAFLDILETGFNEFLEKVNPENPIGEYLLPTIIDGLLEEGRMKVQVLQSHDKWFGVTYKEDKKDVVEEIQKLIADGVYQENLFEGML